MRYITAYFLFLFGIMSVFAQSEQRSVALSAIERSFLAMPDEDYLPMEIRKQMVAQYHIATEDSLRWVRNRFNGKSKIEKIVPKNNWMKIRTSEVASLELKLLPVGDSTSVMVLIYSVCGPTCASQVSVFRSGWVSMRESIVPRLSIMDFLDKEKIQKEEQNLDKIQSIIDIPFIEYFFDEKDVLHVRLNTDKFLEKETFDKVKDYIKTFEYQYVWNGRRFNLLDVQ
ncbi:MAG: DUF3256 family protein [Paludibacteraceae bacterium]|jgi:hypothetical protein|nr:DUF3256 family protein [Paludibacteraceae bacterium]